MNNSDSQFNAARKLVPLTRAGPSIQSLNTKDGERSPITPQSTDDPSTQFKGFGAMEPNADELMNVGNFGGSGDDKIGGNIKERSAYFGKMQ